MPDSQSIDTERIVQPSFMKLGAVASLLPGLCVLLFAALLVRLPDRVELGPRLADVRFDRIRIRAADAGGIRTAGAWTVRVDDSRFGGISALALDRAHLLALTDSGVVVRLPKPGSGGSQALLGELPGGPRNPRFKLHRDTEALVQDPYDRGWWVAFETWHQLWLYDEKFERPLRKINLGSKRWRRNSGIEALVAVGGDLVGFPERGGEMIRIGADESRALPVDDGAGPFSEAVRLPGGTLLLLERRFSWRGFDNALVELDLKSGEPIFRRRIPLPLGRLDNAEALALEGRNDGGLRLWLMTDDNHQRPLRTLLVAFDLPKDLGAGD